MNTLEFHRQGAQEFDTSALAGPRELDMTGGAPAPPVAIALLAVARRQKWIIIGSVVLCFLIGLLATLLVTPKYTAATTVEIQRETNSLADVSSEQRATNGFIDEEFYQTQYGLLQSRSLADRVAADLHLGEDAAYLHRAKIGPKGWFLGDRVNPAASRREDRAHAVGGALLGGVKIVPERLSRLVVINVTNPDPALAQRVANEWAADFIEVNLERRYSATAYARRFLEQRLGQLRDRINDSERKLVAYARLKGIVNLPSGSSTGAGATERPLVADDLASLNAELTSATADRIRAESRLRGAPGDVTESLQNGTLTTLRGRRAEAAADYARTHGPVRARLSASARA